jgi:hypothetical protein
MIDQFLDAFHTRDDDQLLRSICGIGHFFATFTPDDPSVCQILHSDFITIICQTFAAEKNVALLEESVWATNQIIAQGRRDNDDRLIDPLVSQIWELVRTMGGRLSASGLHDFLALVGSLCEVRSDARAVFFGELSGRVEDWLIDDDNPDLQVAAARLLVSFVWLLDFGELPGFGDFFAWMVHFFLERRREVSPSVLINFLEAFKCACQRHPRFLDQLSMCVFESVLEDILTDHEQQTIVLLALELTCAFIQRNAATIRFDPAVLLARGASRDVATATLAFKVIGKLITKSETAAVEYSEDAHLEMMAVALEAAPFAVKMAITRFLRRLIWKAPVADQYRIAGHGFIPLFVEMLNGLESSKDRLEVIRSLMFFCEAGEPVRSGANYFRDEIAGLGGIDLLLDLRVNGHGEERAAVGHLLEVLRIEDDGYEEMVVGGDSGGFDY